MDTVTIPWTLPDVPMERIIIHWTAGHHKANEHDRNAYHLLIEGDGKVVLGKPSIAANSGKIKPGYAAHTLNCNSGSIGVSMACMANAQESPFKAGPSPMTREQFDKMIKVVAELCRRYKIKVTPKTVLTHAEVQKNLGIRQRNKWDITRLPFDPSLKGAAAIGDHIRQRVVAIMQGATPMPEPSTTKPAAPAIPIIPAGGVAIVKPDMLNLRRTPGGDDVGDLPKGTQLVITSLSGDWAEVKTPAGYTGWVNANFLDMVDGPPATAPTKPSPVRARIAELRLLIDQLEDDLGL